MKIAIGQIELQPEQINANFQQITEIIRQGKEQQVDLLVFPAFSVTGYLPQETVLFADFYQDCQNIHEQIAKLAENITIIWGSITYQAGQVTPTVFIAQQQKIIYAVPMQDRKEAYPLSIESKKNKETKTIGISLCRRQPEKIMPETDSILQLVFYPTPEEMISSADETTENAPFTPTLYLRNTGIAYEGKKVFVLPGKSRYSHPTQAEVYTLPENQGGLFILPDKINPTLEKEPIASIYTRTIYGIRNFMQANGLKKVVIGLSGGIDSALNACLYQQAIGAENLLLVNMPSRYNSQLTQDLAQSLSQRLGCFYGVFPIEKSVNLTANQLQETPFSFGETKFFLEVNSFTKENIQARDRGSRLLAAIAQSVSGVFTANCNKTEIAAGYATMYGDQAGFLAATGNLWKHEVYALAQYMDEEIYQAPVLQEIIQLKPSAELSPAQDITKGLGDPLVYDYHDKLFASWEDRKEPLTLEKILTLYQQKTLGKEICCPQTLIDQHFSDAKTFIADLERWWKAYRGMATVKKIQSPPLLIVHHPPRKGNNATMGQPYFSQQYITLKERLLKD